jgi:hypothetical protein
MSDHCILSPGSTAGSILLAKEDWGKDTFVYVFTSTFFRIGKPSSSKPVNITPVPIKTACSTGHDWQTKYGPRCIHW